MRRAGDQSKSLNHRYLSEKFEPQRHGGTAIHRVLMVIYYISVLPCASVPLWLNPVYSNALFQKNNRRKVFLPLDLACLLVHIA